MFVRAYLCASTDDQDASRARDQIKAFATERQLSIAAWYVENESGAKLARPELFRLLADAQPSDILLIEQVDRLSRLTAADWQKLRAEMAARGVRVVSLDLPTSWMMATNAADEFTARMFEAINGMMLDMLAAVARKDCDDRRRRQAQGQARAKTEGRYKGRPEDTERNRAIAALIANGQSWTSVQHATGCSRATIAKIAKRVKELQAVGKSSAAIGNELGIPRDTSCAPSLPNASTDRRHQRLIVGQRTSIQPLCLSAAGRRSSRA
jgi:DNA invertase Pin-like site-specific DNA recombinase